MFARPREYDNTPGEMESLHWIVDCRLTDLKVKKMMEQRAFVDDVAAIMQHLQSGNDNVKAREYLA